MTKDNKYYYSLANGKLRDEAIHLHYQRYKEVGFFKEGEIDVYQKFSTYFTSQSYETNKVVGVIRLISKKLDELPTIKNFNIFDLEKAKLNQLEMKRYAEISAFTKLPQHDVGLGLMRKTFQYSLSNGITNWICCIDERVYNYMFKMFKFPLRTIGIPKAYLGSVSIPCTLNLLECLHASKEERNRLYEYFVDINEESNPLEVVR